MDIYAMHVLFRTLGQQQGLQQVRGILAESIDEFINESIIQNVRVAVLGNSKPYQDVRTPQYTKVSALNAYHTLFVTESVVLPPIPEDNREFTVQLQKTPLVITNFSVGYTKGNKVIKKDCRIIESERLYQTLDDYLNRASHDYPIVSLVNGDTDKQFVISLFTGDSQQDTVSMEVSYLKMPATVHLNEEDWESGNYTTSTSCDLPEHLHHQIVETAVGLWFQTLGLTSEQQQRENNNKN